jgi:hypothetical protein
VAAPPLVPDDAPTAPIRRADLPHAARHAWRGRLVAVVAVLTVVVVVAAGTALALRGRGTDSAAPAASTAPSPAAGPAPDAAPAVPAGAVLLQFTAAPGNAHVSADGSVVAVLDDVSGAAGQRSVQLTTYDQLTGARLAVAGPGMPEILECGIDVVARPDRSSVVLTRYDTETPADGVQLGTRQAHLTARDGRTLQPLWDVVLHTGDSNDQQLLNDTQCSGSTPSFFPTADGRFVLNRSFDVSRVIDLTTGAVRPVPYAVNVVGNDVVVAVPPPQEPGVDTPVDQTGPSTFDAVRLVAASDLHVASTVTDQSIVHALATVGAPGRANLAGFVTPSGSDSRYSAASLSGDARTMAVRENGRTVLVDLPSGRPRAAVAPAATTVNDGPDDPLVIVPGTTPDRDVLLVGQPSGPNEPGPSVGFTAYDLAGHRLWSLPEGAARGICGVDRGTLLMQGFGLATVDPLTGRQFSVDQSGDCPDLIAGLAVTSHQDSSVSTTADYVVRVLRRG